MRVIHSINLFLALFLLPILMSCDMQNKEASTSEKKVRAFVYDKYYSQVVTTLRALDQSQMSKEMYLAQGLSYFKLGDFQLSLANFHKSNPSSVDMKVNLGYIQLFASDLNRASRYEERLRKAFPYHPKALVFRGNIALQKRHYQEARKYFNQAATNKNDYDKAYIGIANTYLLEKKFSKAEINHLQAVLYAKNKSYAYIALIKFYLALQRYEDATLNLKVARTLYPKDINLLLLESNLYLRQHNIQAAYEILESKKNDFPNSSTLRRQLIRCLFFLDKSDEAFDIINSTNIDSFNKSLLEGEYYLRQADLTKSLASFSQANATNPNSYLATYYMGLLHLLHKNFQTSIMYLKKSIKSYPAFKNSNLLLAFIHLYMKDNNLALKYAQRILSIEPDNLIAHTTSGIALYLTQNFEEAQYEFEILSHYDAGNITALFFKALINLATSGNNPNNALISHIGANYIERTTLEYIARQNSPPSQKEMYNTRDILRADQDKNLKYDLIELSKLFRRAIDQCSICYYELAKMKADFGDLEAAIQLLRKALDVNSRFLKAYIFLGSLYEQVERYQLAKSTYEAALRYGPNNATILNNLAWLNITHFDEKSSSYIYVKRALVVSPKDTDINDTLAWWHYLHGDISTAIDILKKVILIKENNPLYQYHLGLAYLKEGSSDALAVTHLRKAIHYGIEKKAIPDIQQLIHAHQQ